MRIAILILIMTMTAAPCMAGPSSAHGRERPDAAKGASERNAERGDRTHDQGADSGHRGGKIIIKGKDGKVIDVEKRSGRGHRQ